MNNLRHIHLTPTGTLISPDISLGRSEFRIWESVLTSFAFLVILLKCGETTESNFSMRAEGGTTIDRESNRLSGTRCLPDVTVIALIAAIRISSDFDKWKMYIVDDTTFLPKTINSVEPKQTLL